MSVVAAAGVGKALTEQTSGTSARAELDKLAQEYIATRKRMKAGSDRTSEMSAILGKMATLAVYVEGINIRQDIDHRTWFSVDAEPSSVRVAEQ